MESRSTNSRSDWLTKGVRCGACMLSTSRDVPTCVHHAMALVPLQFTHVPCRLHPLHWLPVAEEAARGPRGNERSERQREGVLSAFRDQNYASSCERTTEDVICLT